MTPLLTISILAGYFLLLIVISHFTSRSTDNKTFFVANRSAPWYLVAFGMIGASLSGVTFISVTGEVGAKAFSYFQLVLGYIFGYVVIAFVLLPLYYRLNLTSIYGYLGQRFGGTSHKTGAFFFMLSRAIGSSFRLYLVAVVFQIFIFDAWGMPFWVAVVSSLVLILIYTFRSGIKTIVWTDTLQTFFMLLAMLISIGYIASELDLSFTGIVHEVKNSAYSQIIFTDWQTPDFFWKQFISGAFITIVMTGLDQDMMQKNLTVRTLRDSQKNMMSFTAVLIVANFLFLSLGALLFIYTEAQGITLPERSDHLYPTLALNHLPIIAGITFVLGLTAAAYSSADGALTALTTSFCVDFLGFERAKRKPIKVSHNVPALDSEETMVGPPLQGGSVKVRYAVHIGFAMLTLIIILLFHRLNDATVITSIFKAAGYTYGPLLGLFSFGLFTKLAVRDKFVPIVAIASPLITFALAMAADGELGRVFLFVSENFAEGIDQYSAYVFRGYRFGFEILLINGALTFAGLLALAKKK